VHNNQNIQAVKQRFEHYLAVARHVPFLSPPPQAPRMIVVIPCYKEPALLRTLQSLYQCRRPECVTEILVVINHPDNAPDEAKKQNEKSLLDARLWIGAHTGDRLHFHVICLPDVPVKTAGVGLARKTGMDEAVFRFHSHGVSDGVIIGFDADAVCDENYLEEIERAFFDGGNIHGASIYYEHPVEGDEFDAEVYKGVLLYELHLRYLNQAMRYTGFPYACHTVGSAFAVRAAVYAKQGGMNRRKAGEDFHFLHKIIPLGNFKEINTTRVIPSPRESDRVPFGTGASMRQWLSKGETALFTYALDAFIELKRFFDLVPCFFNTNPELIEQQCVSLAPAIHTYLQQNNYIGHIMEANNNSASFEAFAKRFFTWFDGLQMVKYLNYSYMHGYSKQPADLAAAFLLQLLGYECDLNEAGHLLHVYRAIERGTCTIKQTPPRQ
jgi:glycosyltransferase involved in cell wall biosynthesis